MNAEKERLRIKNWKKWGPYVSDRQWGTVREDYSENGTAWDSITHDMARSKAYRWGEEGIAGICDTGQLLCFAIALWNKKDPILKERYFGLTGSEGNHGEDVKEYYFYLDSTPTHSYMKMLYKYPQSEYPYSWLLSENRRRSKKEPEFELMDTGIFNEDKYFDIFIEYAKNKEEDLLAKITIHNRGDESASLRILPTVWFRNTWVWGYDKYKPGIQVGSQSQLVIEHRDLGKFNLYCDGAHELLFTDNETNVKRLYKYDDGRKYYKDGINEYVVNGNQDAINPEKIGTKASADYDLTIQGKGFVEVRLRLVKGDKQNPFADFDIVFEKRKNESDDFYNTLQAGLTSKDAAMVQRQALAGLLWGKQFYYFNVNEWIKGDPAMPPPPDSRKKGRNKEWRHLNNADIISMPDKWEYPWFAAWDLAFHTIPIAMIDPEFAKKQISLLTKESYMHPNGQLPAYEWEFGDVNPPVHPWAVFFIYSIEKEFFGKSDIHFLKRIFNKLLLNFTWWLNRKDPSGKNVFEGGFLGLDNIGVFDRSAPLPTGGHLEQADGTAWMAFYCQNMLTIAFEIAKNDPDYEDMAVKFVKHYYRISSAMYGAEEGQKTMWDEEDHFFYDLLNLPDGNTFPLKIRSLVGLLPLCAATVFPGTIEERFPVLIQEVLKFIKGYPEYNVNITTQNASGNSMLSIMDENTLRKVLSKLLDENEFLSPFGIRSISRYHAEKPFVMYVNGSEYRVDYWPAESESGMFGGNSNWRGPVWFPINALIIRALRHLYIYYGDSFQIECPTGSGKMMNLLEVNREITNRLTGIFLKDKDQRRPVFGQIDRFQKDPYWRDCILFHEYFHGDNGSGIGASHQTGWTSLVAVLIQLFTKENESIFFKLGEKTLEKVHS